LAIPLTVAALASPLQVLIGDWAARDVTASQPVKLAALEGLPHTERGAPVHILGWYSNGRVEYGVRIPRLLSLLAHHDPNSTVTGLDTVPPSQRPPVNVVRFAFQTMVGIGSGMALLGLVFLWVRARKKRLPESRWFYRAVVAAGPLSVVALIAGWVTTEVGRQPWVVYRYLTTRSAVTAGGGIPVGLVVLTIVYLGLAVAVTLMLRYLARTPLRARRETQAAAGRGGEATLG
jgi:cytochrome d ubiquinol oxidase subunit I